ncbi:MAG: acylphosphatase [Burkholderiaceae bacterium]|nr:acylphosphatase [Burkholderiaceae bacterium]
MSMLLQVSGRVQGVGYRAAFADMATRLGLRGWVRNRSDGSVEACIAGNPDKLATMVEWAKHGPPAAKVGQVIALPQEGAEHFTTFSILPTA